MDYVKGSYRAVTSKTAQRTLLNSVLLFSTSLVLYCLAVVAYLLFYHNHLPAPVTTVPVHLQYGYGRHPYGAASLADSSLKEMQDYDITVTLSLPLSPANLELGNFMVALYLLDGAPSSYSSSSSSAAPQPFLQQLLSVPNPPALPDPQAAFRGRSVLHASTRPALIPYADPLATLASRLAHLPYRALVPGARSAERAHLAVPMAEQLRFPRAAGLPTALYVEVQAGQGLQVYEAGVTIKARLRGLRWFMYRQKVLAFTTLTTAFWMCEILFTVLAWAVLSVLSGRGADGFLKHGRRVKTEEERAAAKPERQAAEKGRQIKQEGSSAGLRGAGDLDAGDMSDTPRTFPTLGRQPPLKYEPRIKDEPIDSGAPAELVPAAGAEADDEGEDGDGAPAAWRDSGIGTSYSEAGAGSIRRRGSRDPRSP